MLPWLNPVLFDDFRNKQLSDYLWLLRDEFWTAAGAPLGSPRTCEPGPGQLTLVQNDGQFSIANGQLVIPGQATPAWGDLGEIGKNNAGTGFDRLLGRTLFFSMNRSSLIELMIGWSTSAASVDWANLSYGLRVLATTFNGVSAGALNPGNIGAYVLDSTIYKVSIVLRSVGSFVFVKGGALTNWTLLWAFETLTTSPLYPLMTVWSFVGTSEFFRVIDLPPASIPSRAVVMSDSFKSTVIRDYGDYALDGQPVNVKLDGAKGAYNGSSSYTNIYSAELNRVFDGKEGSIIARAQVSAAGIWTDGLAHEVIRLQVDANNILSISKSVTNSRLTFAYTAGGAAISRDKNGVAETGVMTLGISYSDAGDYLRAFYNGAQEGADVNGAGVWAGSLAATTSLLGSINTTPASVWNGNLLDLIVSVKAPGAANAIVATPAQMSTIHTALAAGTLTKATLEGIFGVGGFVWYKHTDQYISDGKGHVEGDIVRANDSGGNALHGLHNHVGLPGGYGNYEPKRAPLTNIYSTTLNTKFNGQKGFACVRVRVKNQGVWSDAADRYIFRMYVNANNYAVIYKSSTNGRIVYAYNANAVAKTINKDAVSTTDWIVPAFSWDLTAGVNGEVKFYYNGAQEGATATALGTWAGALAEAVLGNQLTPTLPFSGDISDCIIGLNGVVATPAQMATLNTHLSAGTLSGPILDQMFGANNWAWYEFNETALLDGSAITHVGPTWERDATYHAVNEPTPGAEVLIDPGLETWNSATDLTNYTEALAGTSTVNREAVDKHGGSFAARLDVDAGNSQVVFSQSPAGYVGGEWVKISVWSKSNIAGKTMAFLNGFGYDSTFPAGLTTSYVQYFATGCVNAAGPGFGFKRSNSASSSLYFDDASVKNLTFSELISVRDYGTPYVIIDSYPRITGNYQCGGVACYRASDDSGLNFYYNQADGKAHLDQKAAGVWSSLIAQVAAYSAGAPLRLIVQPSGTNLAVALYYNNVLMGTIQTVNAASIINNTMHGPFSTDVNAALDAFVVMPTGAVDGRFNPALDPYTRPA